jgi:26S proteasome regulatory subunit N7
MDAITGDTSALRNRKPTKNWTEKEIQEELKKHDDKIEEAKNTAGDMEVRDAILDKAEFLKNEAKDYPEAERIFRDAYSKSGGASKKMEILFEILLMNIEKLDLEAIKKDVNQCKLLVDEGADWDKKNKLKIYEGVYCMMIRDLKRAAELFMSSIATFTAVELMDYKDFVFYTVVTSMVSMDRKTLRKDVIHSPDILAVIRDIPYLRQFMESFYNSEYRSFFEAFVEIIEAIKRDVYLNTHANYYIKEMRLVAYTQYLASFKSVTIENMARAFGVSAEFIDKELSAFIYAGKINCKIDKVSGVIESNRPNRKGELFNNVIK